MRAVSEFRVGKKREAGALAVNALNSFEKDRDTVTDEILEDLVEILTEKASIDRDFAALERYIAQATTLGKKESERLVFSRADSIWFQKRFKDAADAYKEGLKKYNKGPRAERAQYNLGMCLIGMGKREEAVNVLTELADVSKSVWAESARREIELVNWETKYSSVLKTLPPEGLGIAN